MFEYALVVLNAKKESLCQEINSSSFPRLSEKMQREYKEKYCSVIAAIGALEYKEPAQQHLTSNNTPATPTPGREITPRCCQCSRFGECEYTSVIKTGCNFFNPA